MIYIIIGAVILILALIILAILLIPFHISLYIQKDDLDVNGYFRVHWLRLRIIQRPIPPEEEEKKKEVKKEREITVDKILEIFNQFLNSYQYFIPIIQAFFRSTDIERITLNLSMGFPSPVTTAIISGYFWSVSSVLSVIPHVSLNLTPEFQNTTILDGSIEANIKLRLFWIVAAAIKAFTKKPVRQFIGSIRKLM